MVVVGMWWRWLGPQLEYRGGTDQFKIESKSANCNCSGGIEMSLAM